MQHVSHSFFLPFIKKELVAVDTYSFYFDRTHDTTFDFLPGQYIRLTLPHKSDDRGTSRFFTISSSPLQRDVLVITARIYQSSFKETLLALPTGYEAEFFGSMGTFTLDESITRPQVFLSGGIGVTPFHSMLHYIAEKKIAGDFTLLASFGREERVVFYTDLQQLAQTKPSIKVLYTLSQNASKEWGGEQGRISEKLLRKHLPDIHNPQYSLVGSAEFVAGLKELLVSLHIPAEQIRSEDFTGY